VCLLLEGNRLRIEGSHLRIEGSHLHIEVGGRGVGQGGEEGGHHFRGRGLGLPLGGRDTIERTPPQKNGVSMVDLTEFFAGI